MSKWIGKCGHPVSRKRHEICRDCLNKRITPPVDAQHVRIADPLDAEFKIHPAARLAPASYDEAMQLWRNVIGCSKQDYNGPAKRKTSTNQRIAICSDLHAPFHDLEALAGFIEREQGSDVCIVAGDLQDHYALSRFLKYETVPIHQELAAAQMILERLSEAFPVVLIIEGNHDKPRFEKLLYDRLPMEAIEVIRFLSKTGGLSTIEALCGQFSNVELVKNKIDGRYEVSWYVQHGDLVVTHAEKFSKVPGATLRTIEEWVSDFEGVLNLKPWRVLCQAHTHQLGLFPFGSDKILAETGCLCRPHGYQLAAKIGGRPQRVGWVTLEQNKGVTDLSSVRPYWWEKAQ